MSQKSYYKKGFNFTMKITTSTLFVLLIFLLAPMNSLCQEAKKASTDKKLESRLKSDEKLEDLNSIANDLEKEPFERAKAVLTIFVNHIKTGQTAKDIDEIFGYNQWVGAAEITECKEQEINDLLGQTKDSIVFSIALAPDAEGWSPWCLYLMLPRQDDMVDRDEIIAIHAMIFLHGGSDEPDESKILKFAISYPDGWIEVFAEKGISTACYSEKTILAMELLMKEIISRGGRTKFWFVDFEGDDKTVQKFLEKFSDFSVSVKGRSDAIIEEYSVRDKKTGKQAFLVRAHVYRWISKDRAEVECGDYHDPLGATGTSGIIKLNGRALT